MRACAGSVFAGSDLLVRYSLSARDVPLSVQNSRRCALVRERKAEEGVERARELSKRAGASDDGGKSAHSALARV